MRTRCIRRSGRRWEVNATPHVWHRRRSRREGLDNATVIGRQLVRSFVVGHRGWLGLARLGEPLHTRDGTIHRDWERQN